MPEMDIFIKGAGTISPQNSFGDGSLSGDFIGYPETYFLRCVEPPYKDYLDPMASRRMSRIVRMGVCAALRCIKESGVDMPGAIVTGTGLGCIEDTEKFLGSMIRNNEQLLNPTPFMQSTHNSVAAAIALTIKCRQYNSTYVHRGFSFESALLDSIMLLEENAADNVLVGGLDELTPNSYNITRRLQLWRKKPVSNLLLFAGKEKGSLPGEGVAFFMLGRHAYNKAFARIRGLRTFYRPRNASAVSGEIGDFLKSRRLRTRDIDVVLLGCNGDYPSDAVYRYLMRKRFSDTCCTAWKHLCGEYDTSASFALWIAGMILKEQALPHAIMVNGIRPHNLNNILIYNHLRNINHSLILVSAC